MTARLQVRQPFVFASAQLFCGLHGVAHEYATERPLVDDNSVSLAVVPVERARLVLPPAQGPFPWASGTSRVAD